MEMDEDMEVEVEPVFEAYEVDLDYEFDAARFFDFSREETTAEARESEIWFESAKSYPPSPFAVKLVLGEDFLLGSVNVSPKAKETDPTALLHSDYSVGGHEFYAVDSNNGGCEAMNRGVFGNLQKILNQPHGLSTGLYNHLSTKKSVGKAKPSVKPSFPKSSTLMKPTASQLAKQNRFPQVGGSRFQLQNNDKSLCSSSGVENQAPKRQKLDGGHLCKVTDTKQQTYFVHKVPKKDGTVDNFSMHAKLKLTIPREPELETAHRAQRIRPKGGSEVEQVTASVRRFKARPLNRKIFEAPSLPLPKRSTPKLPEFQEFHLKTMERAMQSSSAMSSSSNNCSESDKGLDKPSTSNYAENRNRELRRPITTEQHGDVGHRFKALPLNKKIFASKGDIGVSRNTKRETTVPMEFNFHAKRTVQHNPPTDLFSKLSLASEQKQNNGSHLKSRPNSIAGKGSKENRLDGLQPEHKVTYLTTENPSIFGGKQTQRWNNGCISDIGNLLNTRNLGIR
ncbi:hypothetical protein UlMin_002389 [Ulmus minor]